MIVYLLYVDLWWYEDLSLVWSCTSSAVWFWGAGQIRFTSESISLLIKNQAEWRAPQLTCDQESHIKTDKAEQVSFLLEETQILGVTALSLAPFRSWNSDDNKDRYSRWTLLPVKNEMVHLLKTPETIGEPVFHTFCGWSIWTWRYHL